YLVWHSRCNLPAQYAVLHIVKSRMLVACLCRRCGYGLIYTPCKRLGLKTPAVRPFLPALSYPKLRWARGLRLPTLATCLVAIVQLRCNFLLSLLLIVSLLR